MSLENARKINEDIQNVRHPSFGYKDRIFAQYAYELAEAILDALQELRQAESGAKG